MRQFNGRFVSMAGMLFLLFSATVTRANDEPRGKTVPTKSRGWITIATVGPDVKRLPADVEPDQAVEMMIQYWRNQLDPVLPDKPDLVVLPECCDQPAGFSQEKLTAYYQARGDRIRDFFAGAARENACYIAYPAIRVLVDGSRRNSVTLLDRQGRAAGIYDKNYPTIEEMEQHIVPGTDAPIFECDFGRVGCVICYDLNFEPLRQRYAAARPDLLLFPSYYHGGLMQAYWAYSCRAHFVASCARSAIPSEIRSPTGDILAANTNYRSYAVARMNLDCALVHLDGHKEKLLALKEKYGREVTIFDPGRLGSVLVSSDSPTIPVHQMLAEFAIEPLDDFLQRSLSCREKALQP